jgi:hypothetical protein
MDETKWPQSNPEIARAVGERVDKRASTKGDSFLVGRDILSASHEEAFTSEVYEDVAPVADRMEALSAYRRSVSSLRNSIFYGVFEDITSVKLATKDPETRLELMSRSIEEVRDRAGRLSPRVADMYQAILAHIEGSEYTPKSDIVKDKVAEMISQGELDYLCSEQVSWDDKISLIRTRLERVVNGMSALDKFDDRISESELKERQKKRDSESPKASKKRNRSKPSMDEMERLKEGEKARAIWSIEPPYGGYFREGAYGVWDRTTNEWVEPRYDYQPLKLTPHYNSTENKKTGKFNFEMKSRCDGGEWVSIPVPYTHGVSAVDTGGVAFELAVDQNGGVVIKLEGGGEHDIGITLSPLLGHTSRDRSVNTPTIPDMPANFSSETEAVIESIKNDKRGSVVIARALARHVRSTLTYSNESDYNSIYDSHPNGYFAAIEEHKHADCDVANTYFAALCARAGVIVRHTVGHSVKGKDESGNSAITSGTGHAWSEIWDDRARSWVRIDATPAGDPNLSEEEKDTKQNESVPGDYGEQDTIRPSDEKLEEMRRELSEKKEKLQYTKEERNLAEGAGIPLAEARVIQREITVAENTKLPNGQLVTNVLSTLFRAIVESRKTITDSYSGPVTKREGGGKIVDIVRHKIGMLAGESDPRSRRIDSEDVEEEQVIGGFDVRIIGDKSGSMGGVDENGETLWSMQRRAEYLIFSALHRFDMALRSAGIESDDALAVRTGGISFRGGGPDDIDLDKSLGSSFSPIEKVKLWNSLTNQGGGNGDVPALQHYYFEIKEEIEALKKQGKKDNRLRIVIVCSDGGPDDRVKVQQMTEELSELGVLVVGIGLTESAAIVPSIFAPPFARGEVVRDIDDLPWVVAKYIIAEAIKLFPERAKDDAREIIANTLKNFKF